QNKPLKEGCTMGIQKKIFFALLALTLALGIVSADYVIAGDCPEGTQSECDGPQLISFRRACGSRMRMQEVIEECSFVCPGKPDWVPPECPGKPAWAPPECPPAKPGWTPGCTEKPEWAGGCTEKPPCWQKPEFSEEVKAKMAEIKELQEQICTVRQGVMEEVKEAAAALQTQIDAKQEEIKGIRESYMEQIKTKLDELPDDFTNCGGYRRMRCPLSSHCCPQEIPDDLPDEVKEILEAVKALREQMEAELAAKRTELKDLYSQRCEIWKNKYEEVEEEISALRDQIDQLRQEIKDLLSA
ncbi:MAG: apolipoprotein A1/A4/E family protein, partial [Candidatus Omnitrophica bacterium]|nr:apolipoprotein A1/A4/E family protein [Candidatus Omnitrophota bacterium]